MPFIYEDIEGSVVTDFVNLELRRLRQAGAQEPPSLQVSTEERLRRKRSVLILGAPGVGKTTFVRHVILALLGVKRSVTFFYPAEKLIPFYVPLKAVDASLPTPILRYLLEHERFLSKDGESRLAKLALTGRLLLVLDGYDEIPVAAGPGYVQDEIEVLLRGGSTRQGEPPIAYSEFHLHMESNRVWLTSRPQFFERNPISALSRSQAFDSPSFTVEIAGLGENRERFVHGVFDRYRRLSKVYGKLLSEEYFLQEIDRSKSSELYAMSFNPLFLTVMCYTYAKAALGANSHAVNLDRDVDELIGRCTELLVSELDEGKALDLPIAQRAALLRRRNEFPQEKLQFLRYLAGQLYLDGRDLFDLAYVSTKVEAYFSDKADDPNAAAILSLETKKFPLVPSFSQQLLYCGLFVPVAPADGDFVYDFPHRRFREIYALKHFLDKDAIQELVDALPRRNVSELLLLAFQRPKYRDALIRALLRQTTAPDAALEAGALVVQCLERSLEDYDCSPVVEDFLSRAVEQGLDIRVPKRILGFFRPTTAFVGWLIRAIPDLTARQKAASLAIALQVLEFFEPQGALRLVLAELDAWDCGGENAVLAVLLRSWSRLGDESWEEIYEHLQCSAATRRSYLFSIARWWTAERVAEFAKRRSGAMSDPALLEFYRIVRLENARAWRLIRGGSDPLNANHDIAVLVAESPELVKLALSTAEPNPSADTTYYFLPARLEAQLSESLEGKATRQRQVLGRVRKLEHRLFRSSSELLDEAEYLEIEASMAATVTLESLNVLMADLAAPVPPSTIKEFFPE